MKQWWKLVIAIIVCEAVGLSAVPVTVSSIPTWYATLTKPSFTPPNWLFGPAWTTLYLLMGISFYLVWLKGWKRVTIAVTYFFVQLALNFLWSFLFFGLQSPILGLMDIIILWVCIVLTMKKFFPISKPAAYLLIPYLLWVTFATALNGAIVLLN